MRGLRIAAPAQLRLQVGQEDAGVDWEQLPVETRSAALALLASMIEARLSTVGDGDD